MSVDPSYLSASGYGGGGSNVLGTLKTGVYYSSSQATAAASGAQGVSVLKCHPLLLNASATFDRIACEVTIVGEAGSLIRLGVYSDDGTGYPGNLLFDAGTVAGDVLSSTSPREITISQVLPAGVVWLAAAIQVVSVTQPTVRTISVGSPVVNMGQATGHQAGAAVAYTQSAVAGAFPGTFTTTLTSQQSAPRVLLRKA